MARLLWPAPFCLLVPAVALASHPVHVHDARIRPQSMLSSGLADNQSTLEQLLLNAKNYKDAGMINAFGPLLYGVSEDGAFVVNSFGKPKDGNLTGFEFVQRLQQETALDVYPYLFCDNTIGDHCAPDGLSSVLRGDPQNFYAASVQEAQKYGWKGYQVDVEGMSSTEELESFCEEWGRQLHAAGLQLQVWSSNNLPRPEVLSRSPHIDLIIDMDAYQHQFSGARYVEKMKSWHSLVGKSKAGVGFLTPNNGGEHMDAESVRQICQGLLQTQAAQINFWASVIHDSFGECLCTYLSVPCSKDAAAAKDQLPAPMLAEVGSHEPEAAGLPEGADGAAFLQLPGNQQEL